jgi:NADPH2 dehydrogenase
MLFAPIEIKNLKSKNRIVMAPMCQYQAENGFANDWHFVHYVSRAIGQVGIIIIEASAIEPRGRISTNDLGIWSDEHIEPLKKIVAACKIHGAKIGIQLAHAGRKSRATNSNPVAPSPIPFNEKSQVPNELTKEEINEIVKKFGEAAKRAEMAEFDFVEVHGAHGYLISEFLSPVTNLRKDSYGQSKELFLKEVLESVQSNFPKEKPIFLRVSGEEYHPKGNHPELLAQLLGKVLQLFDVLHVSSGGIYNKEAYKAFPAYQLDYATKLKEILKKPTIAVGKLEDPIVAQKALNESKTDMIAVGRGLLTDPHWPLHAARTLQQEIKWPKPYERAIDV